MSYEENIKNFVFECLNLSDQEDCPFPKPVSNSNANRESHIVEERKDRNLENKARSAKVLGKEKSKEIRLIPYLNLSRKKKEERLEIQQKRVSIGYGESYKLVSPANIIKSLYTSSDKEESSECSGEHFRIQPDNNALQHIKKYIYTSRPSSSEYNSIVYCGTESKNESENESIAKPNISNNEGDNESLEDYCGLHSKYMKRNSYDYNRVYLSKFTTIRKVSSDYFNSYQKSQVFTHEPINRYLTPRIDSGIDIEDKDSNEALFPFYEESSMIDADYYLRRDHPVISVDKPDTSAIHNHYIEGLQNSREAHNSNPVLKNLKSIETITSDLSELSIYSESEYLEYKKWCKKIQPNKTPSEIKEACQEVHQKTHYNKNKLKFDAEANSIDSNNINNEFHLKHNKEFERYFSSSRKNLAPTKTHDTTKGAVFPSSYRPSKYEEPENVVSEIGKYIPKPGSSSKNNPIFFIGDEYRNDIESELYQNIIELRAKKESENTIFKTDIKCKKFYSFGNLINKNEKGVTSRHQDLISSLYPNNWSDHGHISLLGVALSINIDNLLGKSGPVIANYIRDVKYDNNVLDSQKIQKKLALKNKIEEEINESIYETYKKMASENNNLDVVADLARISRVQIRYRFETYFPKESDAKSTNRALGESDIWVRPNGMGYVLFSRVWSNVSDSDVLRNFMEFQEPLPFFVNYGGTISTVLIPQFGSIAARGLSRILTGNDELGYIFPRRPSKDIVHISIGIPDKRKAIPSLVKMMFFTLNGNYIGQNNVSEFIVFASDNTIDSENFKKFDSMSKKKILGCVKSQADEYSDKLPIHYGEINNSSCYRSLITFTKPIYCRNIYIKILRSQVFKPCADLASKASSVNKTELVIDSDFGNVARMPIVIISGSFSPRT
ncbi:hypothetical protein AYI69_g6539 [Smittium culicis]|uniref:Uncharacterized protein n=1 Tax=Smittium culicis TaxID=133412 RepID=A0A1R1XYA6_9FUNG|nr:hypothetical protein AYI69_g6539 [Smittium culicis]